ncbi:MAG TPA: ABC transporter permease [Bacteroidia bacterium]|nr:ABC transporter permease [Bacteroidia bacterium]HNS11831.1 ABC transporter permease [Bacteroidia bacterium]
MEYEIKPKNRININLRELWAFRELLYFFTWRDIKIKYKQTVLGALWAILQPFLLMLVFTIFFSKALNFDSSALPYPIFVYTGLILWNVFSVGITNSGNSLVNNANMIKKIFFPRLLLPLSSILSTLVDFVMTFVLFIGLMIYFDIYPNILQLLIVLPTALLITLFTTFGLGAFLSALNVKYRDFRYVIPFMVQILLFLTPVIYPLTIVPNEFAQQLLALNPMSGAIALLRGSFTGVFPDVMILVQSLGISVLLFFSGVFYFHRTEYYFADLA